MLKVTKFGGSSLADAAQFRKVRDIVLADPDRRVVVVSAPGKRFPGDHKITDLLYLCHAHLKYGVSAESVFDMIRSRYTSIRDELGLSFDLESEFDALWDKMNRGISEAELVSRGEYFSARLMAAYLNFTFIDAAAWLVFRLNGELDKDRSYEMLKHLAGENKIVIPGFYGAMEDGRIHVMSRGGSDITGAYAAAALDADAYENWTDVSGILMADPRIVPEARSIPRITYSELRELSYMGAQVLHEATVFPVREKNIPVNIRNTNDPSDPGTFIREFFDDEPSETSSFITGIAGKAGFLIFTITKTGMSSELGSLRRILEIFERYNVTISYAPSGIDCYSVVVEEQQVENSRYSILADLKKEIQPDKIHVSENISIIAVVGRKMAFRSGSSGKIFTTLGENGINIRMISQGPEELNILIGVKEKDYRNAIGILYRNFVD
ncbi:MAG: aspartate kinase [Lachnospiraceae bacterium]|nr:aspartate kinase [Lachnospiraceae bacterium]